ncbi:hypothetical protein F5888DRAFT_1737354 [Russula emetica]|nr:hypothetical protein F5888DRAFT_1737354 [Russula emetica]
MFTRLASVLSHSRSYSTGPNKAIIDLLTRCLKEEDSSPSRNGYKIRSFQTAIATIYEHKKPIRSGQEAIKLRGIGLGIANRIDFFLRGKEYDEGWRDRLLAIETFQKIPGIGERTATNLVNAGAASVSDLRLPQYASLLTPAQKVGVLYGDHMTRPIPRAEAEEIAAFIRYHISCNFELHLTGAYRRESPELPGVSILLFHPQHIHVPIPPPPSTTTAAGVPEKTPVRTRGRQHVPFLQVNSSVAECRTSPLLQDVVRPLQAAGLLAATLASDARKWRGVALLPQRTSVHADIDANGPLGGAWQEVGDRMRDIRATRGKYVRLDLSLAPPKSRGAAQIILTGDEEFVRIARIAAARHGMYLNEYGLWRWHSSEEASLETQPDDDAINADPDAEEGRWRHLNGYWELVEGENEDRILDELELGSIAPQRRNFRFLPSKKRASARAGTLDYSSAVGEAGSRRRDEMDI